MARPLRLTSRAPFCRADQRLCMGLFVVLTLPPPLLFRVRVKGAKSSAKGRFCYEIGEHVLRNAERAHTSSLCDALSGTPYRTEVVRDAELSPISARRHAGQTAK